MHVLCCTFPVYVYSKFLHKNHKQEIKSNNYNRAQWVSMVLILLIHTCESFYARARVVVSDIMCNVNVSCCVHYV